MSAPRRAAALLLAVAATFTLAACTPQGAPAPGATSPGGQSTVDPDAEPTCATIIPKTLVADFEEYGLEAFAEPCAFGDPATTSVPGGITCKWGNPEVPTDHGVQIYGWAPLDAAGRKKWTAFLADEGWTASEEDGFQYFGDPFVEGGMTYGFGKGFVILADTKEGLALVSFP